MSTHIKNKHHKQQPTFNTNANGVKGAGGDLSALDPALRKALGSIQKGDYAEAANVLASGGRDSQVRNALGVCLLRMGRVDKAVDVFRSFVLSPGTVVERADVSNAAKRNFATALLMKGFPSGALSVLEGMNDPDHLMAVRLSSAIRQWEKSLSWFRRLDWKLNRIEPSNCHVPIDFEPGEFEFEIQIPRPIQPSNPRKGPFKLAA